MYNLLSFEKLVVQYLELLVAENFGISYHLRRELLFTKNIVSKKLIVVANFSKKIDNDSQLKVYLSNIIYNINLRSIRGEQMYKALNP